MNREQFKTQTVTRSFKFENYYFSSDRVVEYLENYKNMIKSLTNTMTLLSPHLYKREIIGDLPIYVKYRNERIFIERYVFSEIENACDFRVIGFDS